MASRSSELLPWKCWAGVSAPLQRPRGRSVHTQAATKRGNSWSPVREQGRRAPGSTRRPDEGGGLFGGWRQGVACLP
eukprot:2708655-Pyramimonas_sp.AAC.1